MYISALLIRHNYCNQGKVPCVCVCVLEKGTHSACVMNLSRDVLFFFNSYSMQEIRPVEFAHHMHTHTLTHILINIKHIKLKQFYHYPSLTSHMTSNV